MTLDAFMGFWAKAQRTGWDGGKDTAAEWARSAIAHFYGIKDQDGSHFLNQGSSLASNLLRECAKAELATHGAMSDETGAAIAERTGRDFDCDTVGWWLVFEAATEGWPLPKSLHEFAATVVRGRKRAHGKGERYWRIRNRNLVGAAVLYVLTKEFGLRPTRSTATTREVSACDVLAQASVGYGWAAFTYDSAVVV